MKNSIRKHAQVPGLTDTSLMLEPRIQGSNAVASQPWCPAQDVAVYLSDLRDLFHLPLEEEYVLTEA